MANPSRFLIIVALVVGGILVLANAFETGTVAATPEPSPSPAKTGGQGRDGGGQDGGQGGQDGQGQGQGNAQDGGTGGQDVTDINGLRIAVFNATDRDGLAGQVDVILTRPRYGAQQAMEPGNSAESLDTTGIYFEEDPDGANEAAATFIAEEVLDVPDAVIEPIDRAPGIQEGRISSDVQVAVFVGADYAG